MRKHMLLLALAFFLVLSTMPVHATGESPNLTLTTEPSSLASDESYDTTWSIADDENDLVNVTYRLFVNSVNTENQSTDNIAANATSNFSETISFSSVRYVDGDSVFVSATADDGNSTSEVNATTLTVTQGENALIASDTLEGFPQMGTDVGDFMGNLAPGLFKFLVLLAIASGIVAILLGIFMMIKKQATSVRQR